MIWYGMIWYGMVWYDMVWNGMIWYGMYDMIYEVWYMIYDMWYMIYIYMIWYDMIWHGMIWYGMIWYGMRWDDMIYGMIWYYIIWFDMIWYGMIWYYMVCIIYIIYDQILYLIRYDMWYIWYIIYDIWYMIYDIISPSRTYPYMLTTVYITTYTTNLYHHGSQTVCQSFRQLLVSHLPWELIGIQCGLPTGRHAYHHVVHYCTDGEEVGWASIVGFVPKDFRRHVPKGTSAFGQQTFPGENVRIMNVYKHRTLEIKWYITIDYYNRLL